MTVTKEKIKLLRSHGKEGLALGLPVMIAMLGQVLTGVADSVMVGWTGSVPLAACSLGNVFFVVPQIFGIGISYAITPLVSEALGGNEHGKISQVLKHGIFINVIVGILLSAIAFPIALLIPFLNQPDEVVALAVPYINILAPSLLFIMIFQTFRQFAEGMHFTKISMYVMVGGNLLNVVLNYFFIFDKIGLPEAAGIRGAAWATLISRVAMGAAIFIYIYRSKKFAQYKDAYSIGNYSRKLIKKLLQIGIPAGGQFIFEGAAFGMSGVMMGWLGAAELAAHQIALNLATVSYMITSGLGAAATIRIGYFYGKKDIFQLKWSAYSFIAIALLMMCVSIAIFILFRYQLPHFYVDDNINVINTAANLLVIAAFFQLSDGFQVVCVGILRGLQDVKIPSLFIFVAYWAIALPVGYFSAFKLSWGPMGIWFGLLVGLSVTAVAIWIRLKHLLTKVSKQI